ncbi:hypothetical protein [Polluticoccus soli]|uniref:hypothetical protein n=1 Tax=Polluticoccus soli TaxID=3034150 RepID=UPI0023E1E5C7|nr:hypothetical protein [Flavipsychrobacter sp. JY13-12]
MKLSLEQASKLLNALLGDAAVVADEHEADTDLSHEQLISTVNDTLSRTLRPSIEEQLKPALEAGFTGRYLGALRSAAQRVFNVPKRELEDMSIEQVLSKCKGAFETRASQSDDERFVSLEAAIHDYESQIDQLKATHEAQLKDAHDKYVQRDIAARCISIIEKLPRKGGDLHEQADMLRYKMSNTYEVRYNEQTKQLEFYKEGKPATSEDNTPITDENFARNWAEKAGILVSDTRHISPADVKAGQQGQYATGVISISNSDDPADDTLEAIAAWAGQ